MIQDVRIVKDGDTFGPVALVKHIGKALQSRRSARARHVIQHDGVEVEVSKSYIDDCLADGQMELARWFREGQHLVMIYHWLM